MINMALYAICDWEHGYSGIISLKSIQEPRKGLQEYFKGEKVTANFKDKTYSAGVYLICITNFYVLLYTI